VLEKLVIEGGRPLSGDVAISGAKNSALPILASSILSSEVSSFSNIPHLKDVETTIKLLSLVGSEVHWQDDRVSVHCPTIRSHEAPYDLVRTMRASILLLGPLVARYGKARISLPGGCAIGARPINLHLRALSELGCDIKLVGGYVEAHAKRLRGGRIRFEIPTVTGTMNALMAACLASGTTVIQNAAREPEIDDLAKSLIQRGAKISGVGTAELAIDGVEELGGVDYQVMADRIEAGTYLIAGAITKGKVRLTGCKPEHMQAVLDKLIEAGCSIETTDNTITLRADGELKATHISTQPFPGFPTDMQAQMMSLLSLANGTSTITENIFENRFMHVSELKRMGAKLSTKGKVVVVEGVQQLSGAPVMATDLRASASLVVAGLAARNTTEVRRIYHLDRGYEKMDEKLRQLGATVRREKQ
jgi:UDP-N-acetylglucosamine 1-carboxyvinyltransferase